MPWRPQDRRNTGYNTAEWRRARLACLRAAKWRCQIRIPGVCTGSASEVDHVDGIAADPHHRNLRAACKPCHRQVTARQGSQARAASAGRAAPRDPAPAPRTRWDDPVPDDDDPPPF